MAASSAMAAPGEIHDLGIEHMEHMEQSMHYWGYFPATNVWIPEGLATFDFVISFRCSLQLNGDRSSMVQFQLC